MSLKSENETEDSSVADSSIANWPLWQPPPGLPEPAREVWLAGLGALARAQAEGGKAFEALVRQGLTLQAQTSEVAQARIAEAAQAAAQPWQQLSGLGGLSSLFEDRVAHALAQLGLPTAHDWAALQARVKALEAGLSQGGGQGTPRAGSKPRAQPKVELNAAPRVKAKSMPKSTSRSRTRSLP
jgi:poly(hydroxyalkanoate) granule-associated protein